MPPNNDDDRERIEEFIENLLVGLPPVIARREVRKVTGGVITSKTLANEDGLGTGPEESYRVGKNVVYPTKALLEWIIKKYGVSTISRIKPEKGAAK